MLKLLRKIFSKLNYLFYVGSTDILPEPLEKEEEEKYINLFLNGDMKARDKLIEHNLRLVVFLAKKYDAGVKQSGSNSWYSCASQVFLGRI